MVSKLSLSLVLVLLCVSVLPAQQPGLAPFTAVDKAVKQEPGGWAGDRERLSIVFDAERKRLDDQFESELLGWLGSDVERHYWISFLLEDEIYLHGNKPLRQLSLLIKQQGLALIQGKDDEESRGCVVGFNFTAAILSDKLGLSTLATSYKNEAERLLQNDPELGAFLPAVSTAERHRYEGIKSSVIRKTLTVVSEPNPQPAASTSGGVLNGRALNKSIPAYPAAARASGASGVVEVRIVFDETGKVIWAKAASGHPQLRQAAEDAAWQTRFSPTMLSGHPVRTSGIMLYNFVP
jgi:TonB family protein